MIETPSHLAPYAETNATRRYAERPDAYRDPFQVDRDRVLRCTAFRRLDYKTQVFVPHVQDMFRTRLTHTVEVAQVARNLARGLGLNEDLAEAVALAHDLGHAPFGHIGERVLAGCMEGHGGFEHNRQSLRIVDYLEHPFPDFRGLNLTDPTRECMAKHETKYDDPACEQFANTGLAPLEGQIVDAADEIAYTVADLEDALMAGWIDDGDLADLGLWSESLTIIQARYPDARPIHHRIQTNRLILHRLCEDLLAATQAAIAEMDITTAKDVRAAERKAVGFSPAMRESLDQMQRFLLNQVYRGQQNRRIEEEYRGILEALFAAYVSDPSQLPDRYGKRIDTDGLHRVICDYIAGMTDRYCKEQYEELKA